jgi:hypothetical protein
MTPKRSVRTFAGLVSRGNHSPFLYYDYVSLQVWVTVAVIISIVATWLCCKIRILVEPWPTKVPTKTL